MSFCRKPFSSQISVAKASISLGLVPTLGGLHEGHLSLVRQARLECDRVLVSIYLNPSQFDSAGDLEGYPADLQADLEACRQAGGRAADSPIRLAVCVPVCVHACTCACLCVCVPMHASMHASIYLCVPVRAGTSSCSRRTACASATAPVSTCC